MFKIKDSVKPIYGSPTDDKYYATYHAHYISFRQLYNIKFGGADNIYVILVLTNLFLTQIEKLLRF